MRWAFRQGRPKEKAPRAEACGAFVEGSSGRPGYLRLGLAGGPGKMA